LTVGILGFILFKNSEEYRGEFDNNFTVGECPALLP